MIKSRFSLCISILVLLFLYLPIILLVANSFNTSRFGSGWNGFTWKWYLQLFSEPEVWKAVGNSLIIGFSSTFVSTIIGTCSAFALYRYKTPLQNVHYGFIYSPLVIPDISMGISLLLFFIALNISLGLTTIFIAHTTFCISYIAMLMLSKLQNFDFSVVEAAQDLGASSWQTLRCVIFPLLAPALVAAALLSFTLSLDDFVITFFVAGEGSTTLPLYIYSMIKYGSTPIINALSALILLATFIFVWIHYAFTEEETTE